MKKRFTLIKTFLLVFSFFLFASQAYSQGVSPFDIYTIPSRFGPKPLEYFNNNKDFFQPGVKLMTEPHIVYPDNHSKTNLTTVKAWLTKYYPSTTSTGWLILDWETGPYDDLRDYPKGSTKFVTAENELLKLINYVKNLRPNVKVSIYQMPFRVGSVRHNDIFNAPGKFDKIFPRLDFICPSVYILKADEEVGHANNLDFIKFNLDVALPLGKKFNKPVHPFVWHKIHPNNPNYGNEIIQKEVFAKYIKYIYNYSLDGTKASGIWWWDGVANKLADLSGIKNHLDGSVYNESTYDAMIVKYAEYVKKELGGTTTTTTTFSTSQKVVSYTLVNADTDTDILTIANGATLNLATLPTKNLSIRANTNPATVGSVRMALSGTLSKTVLENIAPYALFGGSGTDYTAWVPALGSYTVKATPYTAKSGGGTAGTALTINFNVVDQATAARFAATDNEDMLPATTAIYPNPVKTKLHIQLSEAGEGLAEITLNDLTGRIMLTKRINNNTPSLTTDLDVQSLSPGVYILLVETPKGRTSKRIVVQ